MIFEAFWRAGGLCQSVESRVIGEDCFHRAWQALCDPATHESVRVFTDVDANYAFGNRTVGLGWNSLYTSR